MIPLNITLDNKNGVTTLSNVFIDDFMKDANDAELKVYLYLLRMAGAGLPTDIAEIADHFNHTEKDVIKSLKYWEKQHILRLSTDEDGVITGVILNDVREADKKQNTQKKEKSEVKSITPVIINQDIPMIKMDYEKEKASYSPDNIKALLTNPEASMLLNAASQYFGRTLNPNEIRTLLFIYDRLAFSLDLTDYLIEFCVEHGQKSIHYIEKTATNWYEQGIDTVAKAKSNIKKGDKSSYSIMKLLGKKGDITERELSFTTKWTQVYGFDMSIIEEACNRTVMKTDDNRFPYADSILTSWYEKNVHTLKDIERVDKEYESSRPSAKLMAVSGERVAASKSSDFCRIEKRDYDFDELERLARKRV